VLAIDKYEFSRESRHRFSEATSSYFSKVKHYTLYNNTKSNADPYHNVAFNALILITR